MNQPEKPLAWWELSGTRRAVAISFIVSVVVVFIALYPDFKAICAQHTAI
jgi:hypothetical protein